MHPDPRGNRGKVGNAFSYFKLKTSIVNNQFSKFLTLMYIKFIVYPTKPFKGTVVNCAFSFLHQLLN